MLFHTVRSKATGLAMALIIVMLTWATFAAVQVQASGPTPSQKTQANGVSGAKTNVALTTDKTDPVLTAETAAKVIEDKKMEMGPYSTTFLEKNPELATVMAAKVMEQQPAANNVANSVLPGRERWITVPDPLERDFQLANHYLLHRDYPAAAAKIREGANFLQAEETALEQEVPEAAFAKDLAMRSATIDQLNRLADQVAHGQASIKNLDAAATRAYQVDVEHGVSKLLLGQTAIGTL
jgi:hypothetical protein